jgi:hypothetical protein
MEFSEQAVVRHKKTKKERRRFAVFGYEKGVQGISPDAFFIQKKNPRQLPTFPHNRSCSIIGVTGLNYRVRDGNGCGPCAMVTGKLLKTVLSSQF